MEQQINNNHELVVHDEWLNDEQEQRASSRKPFILANTEEVDIQDIRHKHIIPVYVKDNEPLLSHLDFIESTWEVANHIFGDGDVASPKIRVSHPIKGRVPEARNKPASELKEWEKTLYYERMMFIMEIPANYDEVDGTCLTLTVGGVKAYNLENLYNRVGSDQHFKVFIGFKVSVCTNLCVHTDGFIADLKVKDLRQLKDGIYELLTNYNAVTHLQALNRLTEYSLTEKEFAELVGRARMYRFLPLQMRTGITPLELGDQQLNTVVKDYYNDKSFCRNTDGSISLWRLFNLFTNANKSSYIDNFLDRNLNAFAFTDSLRLAIDSKQPNWFIA
jgi:hypothetical protein